MSGIVGILNLNGAPVDPQLLGHMTDSLAFRGPDAQASWIKGNVGFGHTLLRTTDESANEQQPFSFDGHVWITADARIDAREDLIRKLAAEGRDASLQRPDVELILHAYFAWGEDCLEHLLGDFAFAIWDECRQTLFCARDHFGAKPFYYACVNGCLIISNTLNCIRIHPEVSDKLNEQAISDFLLVGSNEDFRTTTFSDIHRLPAAHTLMWAIGELKLQRYWTLPIQEEIRFRRENEYIEYFVELLDVAVKDRLRTNHVGVFMSGGLDSSTIAATAQKVLSQSSSAIDLKAFTVVYDWLIPDQERYWSGLVAKKLDIPISYMTADDYRLFERWGQPDMRTPEPYHAPLSAIGVDRHKLAAAHSRVVLTGEGGDVFLRASSSYLPALYNERQFGRLVKDFCRHLLMHRQLSGMGMGAWLRQLFEKKHPKRYWSMAYPDWVNPAFASRLNLSARWEQINLKPKPVHPRRPEAYAGMTDPCWATFFEEYDAGVFLLPVEVRHPLFDVRLVNYSMRLPSLPWCVNKELMRASMCGVLPESVRRRPKAPVAASMVVSSLQHHGFFGSEHFDLLPELAEYIDQTKWQESVTKCLRQPVDAKRVVDAEQIWMQLRPLSLNYWMQSLRLLSNSHSTNLQGACA